jgi:thiol:disulfide interchange protein DsbA
MVRVARVLWSVLAFAALAACSRQSTETADNGKAAAPPAATQSAQPAPGDATAPSAQNEPSTSPPETAATTPTEAISETGDTEGPDEASGTPGAPQPTLKLGATSTAAATSSQFKEGTHYTKFVPAQPTSVSPGKIEVVEIFWYACPHCYHLDPLLESWRKNGKAAYVDFVRVPAMWNDALRMHARLFYTAELLGKLDALHTQIFNEINAKGNPLNTADRMAAFFKQQGVSQEEFQKAFASFAVESKLQRADFLNRRYRIDSVPVVVVNGKYKTDIDMVKGGGSVDDGEQRLFTLINELAAHEHGS